MSSGSAILALVEGIDLLRENVRFPHSVPVESRGAVALHFISYSHIDGSEFALRLHHALRHGDPPVDVFIDGDIQLGKQWDEDVEHAIDDCETFLFVMTHDSVSAQSTAALELKRAFNRKKPIIPLQLHPDAPAPLLLGNRFEEVSTPPEMWQEFGDLTPQLFQFRLLVRGQDYENAAHLLLEISPYLLKWGYGRELLEGHQGLVGKLDDPMLAQANMGSLGTTLFELGRYEEAVDCYRRAVDLAQPLDDPMAANRWVLNEGSSYYQLGETERALRHYQQARKAVEDAGQQVELRWALAGIALCESDFGHFDLAMRHSEEALELARTAEDAMLEIDLLAYLGNFHGQLGQREPATTQLNRALKRARGEGYRHAEIQCLTDLAELRLDDGEYEEAAKLARGALKANQALGETQLAREAGYVLALAYLCEGAEAEARMAIDQACEYRPRRWTQPALDLQGIVLLRQNRPREAREAFLDAAQEAETLRRGGAECFFALDALGLARLGLACCGDDRQASEAAGRFWDARAITKADRVVRRLALLLDQLALAEQATLVDSVRPYAAGSASSPPPGRTAPAPRSNTSPEPVA
jgi:tetratricopeptide (TPR) repeat protein